MHHEWAFPPTMFGCFSCLEYNLSVGWFGMIITIMGKAGLDRGKGFALETCNEDIALGHS